MDFDLADVLDSLKNGQSASTPDYYTQDSAQTQSQGFDIDAAIPKVRQIFNYGDDIPDVKIKEGIQTVLKQHPDVDPNQVLQTLDSSAQAGILPQLLGTDTAGPPQKGTVSTVRPNVPSDNELAASVQKQLGGNVTPTLPPQTQDITTGPGGEIPGYQSNVSVGDDQTSPTSSPTPSSSSNTISDNLANSPTNFQQNNLGMSLGQSIGSMFAAAGGTPYNEYAQSALKTNQGQDEADPKSGASQIMQGIAQKFGLPADLVQGKSATQLLTALPFAKDIFDQQMGLAGHQLQLQNSNNMLDERQLQSIVNSGATNVNLAKSNTSTLLGQNANKYSQGLKIQNDLQAIQAQAGQPGGIVANPAVVRMMITDLANYANTSAGKIAQSQIEEMAQHTLQMDLAHATEWITNHPADAKALAFLQNAAKFIDIQQAPLEDIAKQGVGNSLGPTFQQLDQIAARNPKQAQAVEAYKQQLAQAAGISPAAITNSGGIYTYDRSKDTSSLGAHMLGAQGFNEIQSGKTPQPGNSSATTVIITPTGARKIVPTAQLQTYLDAGARPDAKVGY